ncbi:MAG: glycosyltransferase, partial [Phycisphaerae bacterium]
MSGTTHHQVANPAATERPGDVIFAGGGTGGHLYPAIGIATQLRALHPEVNIRFFTTDREIDRHILEPTGFDMLPQSLPHVSLRPWRWARFVLAYRSAIRRALHSFVARRPSVVVGTGGFGS